MDDVETLLAARDGSHAAGCELLRRHGASMTRTAWNVIGHYGGAEAEDVVQESIIAALTTTALPHGDVGAWLRAIVARKALDTIRQISRRGERSLESTENRAEGDEGSGRDSVTAVLTVRRALARLSPADRAVLVLVDLEGLSMAEAAEALSSTTMAVKWRAVRARRRLRAAIEGKPEEMHD